MLHVSSFRGAQPVMKFKAYVGVCNTSIRLQSPNHSNQNMYVKRNTIPVLENQSIPNYIRGKKTDTCNRTKKPVLCSKIGLTDEDNQQVDHCSFIDLICTIWNRSSLLRSKIWSHATKFHSSVNTDLFILVHLHPLLWLKKGEYIIVKSQSLVSLNGTRSDHTGLHRFL